MDNPEIIVWTIGHSTHSYERFLELLRDTGITAIADVRTSPYSRHFPQFNQDVLKAELKMDGIAYSFLGKELGGRPADGRYYCDGVADYEKMAEAPNFRQGIGRVMEGAGKFRIALMCSEHDPLDCHRCLLVGRTLAERDAKVMHILSDGGAISQDDIEEQLVRAYGRLNGDLFLSDDERLSIAYRAQARKVAFAEPSVSSSAVAAE